MQIIRREKTGQADDFRIRQLQARDMLLLRYLRA